jgi:DNA-binding CsgD family transcriptional regulator
MKPLIILILAIKRKARIGEQVGTSKLTTKEVMEIKLLCGKIPQKEIASKYKVNRETISDIGCNRTWKHVKL